MSLSRSRLAIRGRRQTCSSGSSCGLNELPVCARFPSTPTDESPFLVAVLALVFAFFVGSLAFADEEISAPPPTPVKKHFHSLAFTTVVLSFVSWNEEVQLNNPTGKDKASANYFGNSLLLEEEYYQTPHFGYLVQGGVMLGLANVGGTQTSIPYHLVDQRWWAGEASVRVAYRLLREIIMSAGPNLIYRHIDLPTDTPGTNVTSGANVNMGFTADLRMRLTSGWELREEIGALAVSAKTFWSVGLGYKF